MNTRQKLSEREFEIINIIASKSSASQRDVSMRMGISLGMTNILVRRLITKGYLRIKQLNHKKVEYLLTPRGFVEKTRKSYRYTLKTLRSLMTVKRKVKEFIDGKSAEGYAHFVLVGDGDLTDLIEMVALSSGYQARFSRASSVSAQPYSESTLVLSANGNGNGKSRTDVAVIDMVDEISRLLADDAQSAAARN